jgi:hypothetical protein
MGIGRLFDLALSGIQFKMRYKIILRIEKAGGTSRENAVTFEEAGFDMQEQLWLPYFAGASSDIIKKTRDKRYYIIH